jgi:hypothetical protein
VDKTPTGLHDHLIFILLIFTLGTPKDFCVFSPDQ